jgi:hypothetical protein
METVELKPGALSWLAGRLTDRPTNCNNKLDPSSQVANCAAAQELPNSLQNPKVL